jgi:hypothetical protein
LVDGHSDGAHTTQLISFAASEWRRLTAETQIVFVAYTIFSSTGAVYGTGQHKTDLSEERYATATKWWFMCYSTYGGTMFFVKLSIAWFLLRVTVSRVHRWIIYTAGLLSCASCLCYILVALFQCSPISYYWDRDQTGSCIDIHIVVWLLYMYSTFAVISDFTFALLPAWVVSHLNMKKSMKIALIVLMGMGCMYARPFSTLFVPFAMRLTVSAVRAQE